MAANAVVNSSVSQPKASSEKQGNASPSISSASKADVVPPLGSTNGLTDNIDNPYFKELQKYVMAQQRWLFGAWGFEKNVFSNAELIGIH